MADFVSIQSHPFSPCWLTNKLILTIGHFYKNRGFGGLTKKQVEAERKKYKEQGDHIAEEYRSLQALNKTLHTQEELDNAIASLRKQYEDRIKSKDNKISQLQNDNLELCNDITDLRDKYTELSNQATKPIEVIKEVPRALSDEEIEKLPRVKQLIKDNNNLQNFYAVTLMILVLE